MTLVSGIIGILVGIGGIVIGIRENVYLAMFGALILTIGIALTLQALATKYVKKGVGEQ